MILATSLRMREINDAEAFVKYHIGRTNLGLSHSDREELVCEGLAILVRMESNYDPARGESFRGFANKYLRPKLIDAWHKQNWHHTYVRDPETKKRGWKYGAPALSYEQITSEREDD